MSVLLRSTSSVLLRSMDCKVVISKSEMSALAVKELVVGRDKRAKNENALLDSVLSRALNRLGLLVDPLTGPGSALKLTFCIVLLLGKVALGLPPLGLPPLLVVIMVRIFPKASRIAEEIFSTGDFGDGGVVSFSATAITESSESITEASDVRRSLAVHFENILLLPAERKVELLRLGFAVPLGLLVVLLASEPALAVVRWPLPKARNTLTNPASEFADLVLLLEPPRNCCVWPDR